jgi:hypothetical protein
MFLDLHTETVFGNEIQVLAAILSQYIHSKETNTVTTYIDAKHVHVTANNFYNNLNNLLVDPEPNQAKAQKLDALLVQASLRADKSCCKHHRDWWSHKLTSACCKVHLL